VSHGVALVDDPGLHPAVDVVVDQLRGRHAVDGDARVAVLDDHALDRDVVGLDADAGGVVRRARARAADDEASDHGAGGAHGDDRAGAVALDDREVLPR
jgi:hypothetical protein